MNGLSARFIEHVPSSEGSQADVWLIEPNGDEHRIRCLLRGLSTEIAGSPEALTYLHTRYTDQAVCFTAREAVLQRLNG